VSEPFTRVPGVHVTLEETLGGCEEILDGQHDALPEQAFYMCGSIEDAVANAKKLGF
jgi:F-type H+-transporting ATPase subunit beta